MCLHYVWILGFRAFGLGVDALGLRCVLTLKFIVEVFIVRVAIVRELQGLQAIDVQVTAVSFLAPVDSIP